MYFLIAIIGSIPARLKKSYSLNFALLFAGIFAAPAHSFQQYPTTHFPGYRPVPSSSAASDNADLGRTGEVKWEFVAAPKKAVGDQVNANPSRQSDHLPEALRDYRSMSPPDWENANPSSQALSNPFGTSEIGIGRQRLDSNTWPSQVAPELVSGSEINSLSQKGSDPLESRQELSTFRVAGEGQPPFGIGSEEFGERSTVSRPKSNSEPSFLGTGQTSSPHPSAQLTSQRNPSQTAQDLFGTPPVPDNIRIDLELPSQEPSSELRLPNSQELSVDNLPSSGKPLDTEFYSNSLSTALLGFSQQPSVDTPGRQPLPPPRPISNQEGMTVQPFHSWQQQPANPTTSIPEFRPDLGHRAPDPTRRDFNDNDCGQSFDFEQKRTEYPSLREIIASGRYFGSARLNFVRPYFPGNTAIFQEVAGVAESFSFGYATAPQFQIGFESKFGPGIEITYFSLRDTSRPSVFTSDGIEQGSTSIWIPEAGQASRLSATNFGETLTARHRIALDSFGVCFFKNFAFNRIRVDGRFGIQTVRVTHELNSQLTDAGGSETGSLSGRSDFHATGPQFGIDYFRPIGHTRLEFLVGLGGSILFGSQPQTVENSNGGNLSRSSDRGFITTMNLFGGIQYRRMLNENRHFFARVGFLQQAWINGGNAVDPQSDFGLTGYLLTVGYNR